MLADERKDFQPVDQLFAVLVRFFALAVCSEQQILELVLDGVKGIVTFEELPQLLRRLRLHDWRGRRLCWPCRLRLWHLPLLY